MVVRGRITGRRLRLQVSLALLLRKENYATVGKVARYYLYLLTYHLTLHYHTSADHCQYIPHESKSHIGEAYRTRIGEESCGPQMGTGNLLRPVHGFRGEMGLLIIQVRLNETP